MSAALEVCDLGRRRFGEVFEIQERRAAERRAGTAPDTLLLVEHEPVYTLGRRGRAEHILASPAALARAGIEVVRTTRGGDVTYHGPGQLVAYPIIDLLARGQGAAWYVNRLEEVILRVLADFGIAGGRDPQHRGVWVGADKIAAVGVRVSGGVTLHGVALNVAPDLAWFEGIVPCGIRDRGVTAMARHAPGVTVAVVKPRLTARFREVFGYEA